jgi:hypothetical protein
LLLSRERSDPEQFTFFDRTFALTSRFAFTSARGGEYRLCFGTNTTTWFGTGQALVHALVSRFFFFCFFFAIVFANGVMIEIRD